MRSCTWVPRPSSPCSSSSPWSLFQDKRRRESVVGVQQDAVDEFLCAIDELVLHGHHRCLSPSSFNTLQVIVIGVLLATVILAIHGQKQYRRPLSKNIRRLVHNPFVSNVILEPPLQLLDLWNEYGLVDGKRLSMAKMDPLLQDGVCLPSSTHTCRLNSNSNRRSSSLPSPRRCPSPQPILMNDVLPRSLSNTRCMLDNDRGRSRRDILLPPLAAMLETSNDRK